MIKISVDKIKKLAKALYQAKKDLGFDSSPEENWEEVVEYLEIKGGQL